MQIEFNTNRISKGDLSQPTSRPEASTTSTDTTSFTSTTTLEAQLRAEPETRVDKVALAKSLINNPNYPPQELLDRIATLLAVHNLK